MNQRSIWRVGWFALFSLLLTGCAGRYHGPQPGELSVAYIEEASPVWVTAMEGRKVSHFGFSGRQRIIIRPGPHIIEVRYVRLERRIVETWDHDPSAAIVATVPVRSNGGVVLQFTAEAGHTYFIRDGRMGDIWRPRITEDRDPVFIEFDAPKAGPR